MQFPTFSMPSREALSTFASNSKNSALSWGSWALTGLKTRAHSAWESARPQISAFSVKAFDLAWNNKAAVVSAAAAAGITLAVVRLWDRAFPTDAVAAARAETEQAKKDAKDAATKAQTDIDAVRKSIAPQLAEAEKAQKRAWEASGAAHIEMQRMEAQLKERDQTITTLKEQVAVLETRNESLDAQNAIHAGTIASLNAESPARNRALTEAEGRATKAEAEFTRVSRLLDEMRKNAFDERTTLAGSVETLKQELARQRASSERTIAEWTTERGQLKDTVTALETDLRTAREEAAAAGKTAGERITALETELTRAREEAAAAGKTAGERITALETELTRAREEATAAGKRIAALETELAEARKVEAASDKGAA